MTLRHWLEEKPFTLSLSSGFFGFFAHIGFIKALNQENIHPQAYTGASAGAFIAASLASGMDIKDMEMASIKMKLSDFWDPSIGPGYIRGDKLEKVLGQLMAPDFSKLQKPLHIATFDIAKLKTKIFSQGTLPRVVRASAAVPLLFHPVKIDHRFYWDGGMRDKMALSGLPQNERVFCHYLQTETWVDSFERLWNETRLRPETQILQLKGLTQSGPYRLHHGSEIIEQAYRQTLAALKGSNLRNIV